MCQAESMWEICRPSSQFYSSVQSLSHVQLFTTPWTAACQASLSVTNSRCLLKLIPIELVMPYNYLILCHLLLLPPPIFPSIRVFSNESALHIRWSKFWSFSFNISLSNEHSGLISSRTLEGELPRLVGAQYATGDQWRNNSRKNGETEPRLKQHPVVDVW